MVREGKIEKRAILKGIFLLFTILMILPGCVKEEFSINKLDTSLDISPAVATPVGFFNFTMDQVIDTTENAKISVTPEGIISLNYRGEESTDYAGDLFSFSPLVEDFTLPNPTGGIIDLFEESYRAEYSAFLPLFLSNTGGRSELDSIVLSSARILISDIDFPNANGELEIIIPGLQQSGESFRQTILPGTEDFIINLAGYSLELTNRNGEYNLIEVIIELNFPSQNTILFATQPLISFDFIIALDTWEAIYGYLGQEDLDFSSASFLTDFDESFPDGNFYFQDPVLKFRTLNSFGIPIGMSLNPIIVDTRESGELPLRGEGVPEPPDYFYPAYPIPGSDQKEAYDSLILNRDNSNLKELMGSKPQRILYRAIFSTNPGDEKEQNVIYNDSRFTTQVDLHLPFYGRADSLTIRDTLSIDFSEIDIPVEEALEEVIFKLYYENSYPADILLQLYIADANFQISDTLFHSFTLINGVDPSDSYSENPDFTSGELETSLPGADVDNIRQAQYILGEALLTTVGDRDDIKVFENQSLFMRLAMIFDISASIDDI